MFVRCDDGEWICRPCAEPDDGPLDASDTMSVGVCVDCGWGILAMGRSYRIVNPSGLDLTHVPTYRNAVSGFKKWRRVWSKYKV